MITAGSVRGNWSVPQLGQRSTCPAGAARARPPQRGQCRVAQSHSASPMACSTRGASAIRRRPGPARSRAAPPTRPGRPARRPGSTITAKCCTPSRSPSSTRRPVAAPPAARPRRPAVDRPQPGAGDDEHPRRGVGPPLVEPGSSVRGRRAGRGRAGTRATCGSTDAPRAAPGLLGRVLEPGPEGALVVGAAEEVLDQVGGVLRAAGRQHRVAVAVRHLGCEQVVGVERREQVLRDHQAPHVGVVRRGVAVEVPEAAWKWVSGSSAIRL